MSFREQFKATSTKKLKSFTEKEDSYTSKGVSSDFIQIKEGSNKIRLFPKHPDEENFTIMRAQYWLTLENDKGEMGRRTVLSAIVHGNQKKDIVDEYVKFCKNNLSSDEDDRAKLKLLTDWQKGLTLSTSWIAYGKKIIKDGEDQFGLIELNKSTRDGINSLAFVEDEDDVMETDPFTDPDEGYPVIIKYDPSQKKAADKYKVTLAKNNLPLTDEELEIFADKTPLSQLTMLQYSNVDFENALEGLKNFDEDNEINLFDSDEFQDVISELKKSFGGKKKVQSHSNDDDDDENKQPKKVVKTTQTSKKVVSKSNDDDDDDDDDDELPFKEDKKTPSKKSQSDDDEDEGEQTTKKLTGLEAIKAKIAASKGQK